MGPISLTPASIGVDFWEPLGVCMLKGEELMEVFAVPRDNFSADQSVLVADHRVSKFLELCWAPLGVSLGSTFEGDNPGYLSCFSHVFGKSSSMLASLAPLAHISFPDLGALRAI